MLQHMKTSGLVPPQMPETLENEAMKDQNPAPGLGHLASSATIASPLPTPATLHLSASSASGTSNGAAGQDKPVLELTEAPLDHVLSYPQQDEAESFEIETAQPCEMGGSVDPGAKALSEGGGRIPGLSTCEARVAGVFHEHGCVSSVHGLAGIMNPTSRERHKENLSMLQWKGGTAIASSKARLISNAALQKQREARMFRQPRSLLDFDGCDLELAKHLLYLHFNRQHFAYMLSYRPAIMDSLASGGGPWANKLLLNAIFYSSALYSDRECLRSDPSDPQSIGAHFYKRFRELLIDEMDKPSIPSAVALLLTSATLVSQGRSSAGWTLSGTAYRMIIDLGCHMMLEPNYESTGGHGGTRALRRDLEQEMRKRLYWGAYMTDATQALYLGRPCMFASVEARVPLQLLDTFEELEEWDPYIDPNASAPPQPSYTPQPAHAISTFMSLAKLLRISTRITELYGIQSVKAAAEAIQDRKHSIEWELQNWVNTLPSHLKFDPDSPSPPPPHQLTPHTTFHALIILLHRAFLEQGHLRRHSDETDKKRGEEACIYSASMIQKYVRAYRNAFTLRRAPFLLSYAIYSAVTVVLHQERHHRGQYAEPISFFWTCLSEPQRGCNFGLKKPLTILQDMVHEFQVSLEDAASAGVEQALQPSLEDSRFFALSDAQDPGLNPETSTRNIISPDYFTVGESVDPSFGTSASGLLDFLNHREKDISCDSLYGLFASSQQFP